MLWLTLLQLKSNNAATRRKAAELLATTPSPRALSALRNALSDPDKEVRQLAAAALGKFEDEGRIGPLLQALGDRNPGVVKTAILALKRVNDEKVMLALIPLLRHTDAGVRGSAAQVLESMRWQPDNRDDEIWFLVARGYFSRVVTYGPAAFPALEAAAVSNASSLAIKAVEALGHINDPRVQRLLADTLKSQDPNVVVTTLNVIRRLAEPKLANAVVGVLRHGNAQVRSAAAEALGQLRPTSVTERLTPLLADSVWEVRREAADALGRIRDPNAVDGLIRTLKDADVDVREAAALALGNIVDQRAIGPLVLALKDTTSSMRRMAAAALARINPRWNTTPEARSAVEELKEALQHEDSNVRHFVSQLLPSLGETGPESAPGPESWSTTASSETNRRKLAIDLFETLLGDSDFDLRRAAAEALGQLGDAHSRSALQRVQSDADPGVRGAAERALEML